MKTIIRSMRFYFWPILALNAATMTMAIGGDVRRGAWFSIVIALLASFGFLLNDLWDRKVDQVNKSGHFENSDKRTIGLGVAVSTVCLILGMGVASRLGSIEVRIAALVAVGLVAYSVVLRRYLVIPTLLAGFLAASPLWAPLILWPRNVHPMHWAFVAAMVLLLAARETLMDVRDGKGDRAGARDTITTVFGPRIAKSVAVMLLLGGAVLLCLVLITQLVNLTIRDRFTAAFTVCLVLCLVLIPAYRAVLGSSENGADHAAIQRFVLRSRAAMAFLPLLNLFLWAK